MLRDSHRAPGNRGRGAWSLMPFTQEVLVLRRTSTFFRCRMSDKRLSLRTELEPCSTHRYSASPRNNFFIDTCCSNARILRALSYKKVRPRLSPETRYRQIQTLFFSPYTGFLIPQERRIPENLKTKRSPGFLKTCTALPICPARRCRTIC